MTLLIKVFIICISLYAVLGQNRFPPAQDLPSPFNNPRYLERLLKCVMGEVPCDAAGKRIKALAPHVLRNDCPQCSPGESMRIKQGLTYIQRNHPAVWAKIIRTYG